MVGPFASASASAESDSAISSCLTPRMSCGARASALAFSISFFAFSFTRAISAATRFSMRAMRSAAACLRSAASFSARASCSACAAACCWRIASRSCPTPVLRPASSWTTAALPCSLCCLSFFTSASSSADCSFSARSSASSARLSAPCGSCFAASVLLAADGKALETCASSDCVGKKETPASASETREDRIMRLQRADLDAAPLRRTKLLGRRKLRILSRTQHLSLARAMRRGASGAIRATVSCVPPNGAQTCRSMRAVGCSVAASSSWRQAGASSESVDSLLQALSRATRT